MIAVGLLQQSFVLHSINRRNELFKIEMHLHTMECDKCVTTTSEGIVKKYFDNGYKGIVVTDHIFSIFFDWFGHEFDGATHEQIIDRWLMGYRSIKKECEKYGMIAFPGAEIRFDNATENDYLLYGVDEDFFYNAPLLNKLSGINELIKIIPSSACVVQAHPFRNNMTVCEPDGLFGIEVYNGRNDPFRNELALQFAKHYSKVKLSGSDCHSNSQALRGGIVTDCDVNTHLDLSNVLKTGNYKLIKPNGDFVDV